MGFSRWNAKMGEGVNASLAIQHLRRAKSESERLTNNGKKRKVRREPSMPILKCLDQPAYEQEDAE